MNSFLKFFIKGISKFLSLTATSVFVLVFSGFLALDTSSIAVYGQAPAECQRIANAIPGEPTEAVFTRGDIAGIGWSCPFRQVEF